MSRWLISSKTLWNLHRAQGRTEEITAWIAANGLDPADVSADHDLIVDHTTSPSTLRCTAYLRALDGAKYVDEQHGGPAVEERHVPLVVLPPEHWPTWALAEERPER